MNGIEQILDKIREDADARVYAILSEANERVRTIEHETEAALRKNRLKAEEETEKKARARKEQLESLTNLDARKRLLGAKQKAVDEAYAIALDRLKALPEEELLRIGASPETAIRLVRERTLTEVASLLFSDLEA